MTEIEVLRAWLPTQMGKLTEIANAAGVSRRTVQRIINEPDYEVTSSTSSALKRYMDSVTTTEQSPA